MPHIRRTLEAVRSAKPRQIAGRARRVVPARLLAPRARPTRDLRPLPAGLGAPAAQQYGPAPAPHETGRFEAYGAAREWGAEDFWRDDSDGLLFLFHLHGFSTLAEYAARVRTEEGDRFWRDVIAGWLDTSARPATPAWHPFPTSVRLMAWSAASDLLDERGRASFAQQAGYLSRAVEHDVGGNHVLKNATALVFAGTVLADDRLRDRGLGLLEREVRDQLLSDGGHVERSPSYQREIAHELDHVAALVTEPLEWLDGARSRAHAWLAALAGPDGRLPLLNDAWDGPPIRDRPMQPFTALPASGYYVCRHDGDQLVFDAGPLAPRHLPPHAHADALSVVLWMDGAPLLVDPGSFTYTGPHRDEFRSTRAHNTVAVDGRDQCEFWGDFRASKMPRVLAADPEHHDDVVVLRGKHDGYRPAIHERTVVWLPGDGVVIVDLLDADAPREIVSSLTLAPGANPPVEIASLGGRAEREERRHSPWLGHSESTSALVDRRTVEPGEPFGWTLLREGAAATLESGILQVLTRSGETLRIQVRGR